RPLSCLRELSLPLIYTRPQHLVLSLADAETPGLALQDTERRRPGSDKGVIFMTLEEETGVANAIVWSKMFDKYRSVV
ncbi:hypothetical protein ACC703_39675, partial [Rhizobium ruizarguesonis]